MPLLPFFHPFINVRYVIVRYILHHLRLFLPTAGLEVSELAVTSPLLHGLLNTLEGWASVLLGQLETFTAPPPEYIPQCYVEPSVQVRISQSPVLSRGIENPFL